MLIQLLKKDYADLFPLADKISQIILLQNGVYALPALLDERKLSNTAIGILASDWVVSGLPDDFVQQNNDTPESSRSAIKLISENEWVELCIKHRPILTFQ
ncbi:hypothetical protein [Agaribacter flavus]|uniref:Uncharacterized protein n=1 Tax=Agaribacter flavus TaxID=1902781 RepID=A0ABV7FT98_9ALTE